MNIDWDMFFYYGTNQLDINDEDEFDVVQGLMQPQRSLMYFRREGAGIPEFINMPGALSNYLLSRMYAVKWFAFRNNYISNGSDNLPDRRLITSQNIIGIQEVTKGELNFFVFYIPFRDYKTMKSTVISM